MLPSQYLTRNHKKAKSYISNSVWYALAALLFVALCLNSTGRNKALFAIILLLCTIVSIFYAACWARLKSHLRRTLGSEAVDALELKEDREQTEGEVLLGSMPAYLESIEAYRTHKKWTTIISPILIAFIAIALGFVYFYSSTTWRFRMW